MVICEKGGIRRCLMNLLGNALKFTTVCVANGSANISASFLTPCKDGYVHVTLRQLPANSNTLKEYIKLELGVFDTGKVIPRNLLNNSYSLFFFFSSCRG